MSILRIRGDWDIRVGFLHWFETDLALSKVLKGLKRLGIRFDNLRYMFELVSMVPGAYKPLTLSLAATSARSAVSPSTSFTLATGLSSSTCSSLTERGVGRATGEGDLGLSNWTWTRVDASRNRRAFCLRRVNSSDFLLVLVFERARGELATVTASNASVSSSLRFFAGRATGGAETCGGCPSMESARLLPLRDAERVVAIFPEFLKDLAETKNHDKGVGNHTHGDPSPGRPTLSFTTAKHYR